MVPNYPAGGSTPPGSRVLRDPDRREVPSEVHTAVRSMYVGAALGAIGRAVSYFTTNPSSQQQLFHANTNTVAYQDGAFFGALLSVAFVVAMWVWMARKVERGRNWARIVSSVLFGIGVLYMLAYFIASPASIGSICWTLSVIAGLVAIIMLFRPASNAFFSPPVMPYPPGYGYPPPPPSPPAPPAPPQ